MLGFVGALLASHAPGQELTLFSNNVNGICGARVYRRCLMI